MTSDGPHERPEAPDPLARSAPPASSPSHTPGERLVALFEVLLCSGYPSQIALGSTLVLLGLQAIGPDGRLNLTYVVVLSLVDTVVILALVVFFLSTHGEPVGDALIGNRPPGREVRLGIPLSFVAFLLAVVVLGAIQQFAPRLHTVVENPLQTLMRTPGDVAIFGVVVVVAGGVREEIQRAFILRRFERWLGGGPTGLLVTSLAFGGGHAPQGLDAVVATACLGALWGMVYLRRRSVIAPVVSHAGFNLLQLTQFVAIGL